MELASEENKVKAALAKEKLLDEPGRKVVEALMEKYYGLDYEVEDCPPPKPFKDHNQWLQTAKRCISAPVPPKAAVR